MQHTASHSLFVYGSLLSGFKNPAYEYLARYFHLKGEAVVKGLLYKNGSIPVGVPTVDENFVKGELYELNNPEEFSWAMAQLDDYEGLNVEPNETPLYRRGLTNAYVNNEPHLAWVYWYNLSTDGMDIIPGGYIIDFITNQ